MMEYRRSRDTALVILNLVTRRNSMGLRTGLGVREKRKHLVLLPGLEPHFIHPATYSLHHLHHSGTSNNLYIYIYIYESYIHKICYCGSTLQVGHSCPKFHV